MRKMFSKNQIAVIAKSVVDNAIATNEAIAWADSLKDYITYTDEDEEYIALSGEFDFNGTSSIFFIEEDSYLNDILNSKGKKLYRYTFHFEDSSKTYKGAVICDWNMEVGDLILSNLKRLIQIGNVLLVDSTSLGYIIDANNSQITININGSEVVCTYADVDLTASAVDTKIDY